jgi:hypothetical protein
VLWAQLYTGTVTGVVTDPSGAVVPGARLQLVDEQKGFVFTATTDPAGNYLFRNVPPGSYKLSVQAPGFKSETRSGIILDVNHNVTVNFQLQLGATAQTVEVKGQAPVLEAQDAITGQTVDRKFINDLPLVNRSVTDLVMLTPGVTEVDTTCGVSLCTANNFISNGTRNSTADVLMDGVTVTNFEQNSGILYPLYTPSVDAVQEFVVQESNFSAEYGFTGATIVNMVIRSGTNQFHGTVYNFLRNQVMDANNFFNNEVGIPIPGLKWDDFGGTIGGPIKHDKTFFFFDYEGSQSRTLSTFTAGVPTAAERAGDFGELCGGDGPNGPAPDGTFNAQGLCSDPNGQLWDPYTGVYNAVDGGPVRSGFIPFNNLATYESPGNPNLTGTPLQLPATPGNLIDPVAYKLIQYFPLPNFNVGTPSYSPYTNWQSSQAAKGVGNQFDIKIDQRFSDKDLLSVRYSRAWGPGFPLNCFGNVADPCDFGPSVGDTNMVAINHTHTFSPTLLLTASYGLARSYYFSETIAAESKYKGLSPTATLGMPRYMDTSGIPQLPAIELGSYAAAGASSDNIGTQPWSYQREGTETHELLGALNWMKGAHDLKFGIEGRMHRTSYTQPGTPGGLFYYDFTGTSEFPYSGGGDAMASFMTGVGGPGSAAMGIGQYEIPNYVSTQSFQYGGYVQDNWKTTKKLTLNIGLRYDVNTPRSERYNRMNALDPNVVSPITAPGFGVLHGGEIFMNSSDRNNYGTDYHGVGPRIGFAYRLFNKTVIRGGYGIFYSTVSSGAAGTGPIGYQGYDQTTPWYPLNPSDGATPYGRLSNPFPTGVILPPGSSKGLMNDVGYGAQGPIKSIDTTNPYEQSWTFGIQRELPSNTLLDVSYIGKKGTHLYFGGAGGLDYLGSQIEHYTSDQITALNTFVNNPFYGIITDPNSSLSAQTYQAYQFQLPYPQFTGFYGSDPPWANSIYNALQIKAEKRFSHGLQFLATYVWSKSIDDASTTSSNTTWLGGITHLTDPNNFHLERGLSTWDIPSTLQFSYTYELPVGRGKPLLGHANAVVNAFLGGWQTNGIWRFTDGRPEILSLSGGQSLPTYGSQQPNLNGVLRCASSNKLQDYFANDAEVLSVPPPFTLGTAARTDGSCRQPGWSNANLALFKEFPLHIIGEAGKIQFRLESYNALNHPMFSGPNTTVNGGSFGLITSTANTPREVQAGLKIYW